MATLESISKQTADYAKTRRAALDVAGAMQAEIEAVQARFAKQLRKAVTRMTEEHEALFKVIESNEHLFDIKKSITVDGIKVGFQVGKSKLVIADKNGAATLLMNMVNIAYRQGDKAFSEKLQAAVKTEYVLVDTAIKELDARMLEMIGATLKPATNDVLIKPQEKDSSKAIDSIINAVLGDIDE